MWSRPGGGGDLSVTRWMDKWDEKGREGGGSAGEVTVSGSTLL